jgi:glucan phosphoethanolaminetransferase (alkaline phosphatase superfamily)
MEKTTEEMVLNHHGYKTVWFEMRRNETKFDMRWTMKINDDPRKVGRKLAEDLEYGDNALFRMYGLKRRNKVRFLSIIKA